MKAILAALRPIKRHLQWRAERMRVQNGPFGIALMYHRIATPLTDPWDLAVSPENFAAHMDIVKTFATPSTMSDFAAGLTHDKTPNRRIAITFDDGYHDNLTEALPVLEKAGVPATVFVVSGAIGNPTAYWWDVLARIFLETAVLPRHLTLTNGQGETLFDLGDDAVCTTETHRQNAQWRADNVAPQGIRQQVFLDIWTYVAALPPETQSATMDHILDWSGLRDVTADVSMGRPMTQRELSQLTASSLIEIGGHTVTHPNLGRLSPELSLSEISNGRRDLQAMTGKPIHSFSYPFGGYSSQTESQIKAAGFRCAAWSHHGLATSASNAFALPRVVVPNLDAAAFTKLLKSLLGKPKRH